MKLESINFWFLVLCVSVHIHLPNYRFGNMLYSPPKIKVSSKFIFWTTNSFSGSLRKKSRTKVFVNFGLLGIKSVHGQPDSPSWYTDSWSYIAPSREEPHCQSWPRCWSPGLTKREIPMQCFESVEVYTD